MDTKDKEKELLKERTKRFFKTYNQLTDKMKALGVKRKSLFSAANDLSEIYEETTDVRQQIELLITTPSSNLDKMADLFVDLRVKLDHIKDHIVHSRKPLDELAEFCCKDETKE